MDHPCILIDLTYHDTRIDASQATICIHSQTCRLSPSARIVLHVLWSNHPNLLPMIPRLRLPLLLLLLPLVAAWWTQAEAQSPTVVILARHAEKVVPNPPDGDPELTDAGRARATALAEALRNAGVDAVITTQWKRTRFTAQPLAELAGVTPEVVSTSGAQAHHDAVAAAVRRHAGHTVLVVGHSNTVPSIIAALGGPRLPDICDSQYADLFTLILEPGKDPVLIRSHYGASSPAPGPECTPMSR